MGVQVRWVLIKVLYLSQKFKAADWTHYDAWISSMRIKPEYQSVFALFSDHLSVPENELITTAFVNNVVSTDDSERNTEPKDCPVIHSQLEHQVPTSFSASVLLPNHKASFPTLPTNRKAALPPFSQVSLFFSCYFQSSCFSSVSQELGSAPQKVHEGFPFELEHVF